MATEILEQATLPRPRYRYTAGQYIEFEQASDVKHSYYAGEIVAMVGASRAHCLIVTNLVSLLHTLLMDRDFLVFPSDMRVKVNASGLYTYPDVSVVAGEGEYEMRGPQSLLNPLVLIEVLSPSTEEYDQNGKFEHYRLLPSLQHYVLVSQDERRIEVRSRQNDGTWKTSVATDSDRAVSLVAIGCELTLADVYRKVPLESRE